jgi:hypothetical protein
MCVIRYICWTFAWLAAFACATWSIGALYFDFPATVGLAAILFVLVSHKPFTKRRLSFHKCWPPHSHSDISSRMNRSIFYIIGVIVVIVIVLKLLGLF